MKMTTGAQRGSHISMLRGVWNWFGSPAVTLRWTLLSVGDEEPSGEFFQQSGKKMSRFHQEDTTANCSYSLWAGELVISLVILSVSTFLVMQKLLGVCCQQKAKYHAGTTLHGAFWLAVNPTSFLRQGQFLENHIPLSTFLLPPE